MRYFRLFDLIGQFMHAGLFALRQQCQPGQTMFALSYRAKRNSLVVACRYLILKSILYVGMVSILRKITRK
jgi:hypothetical protein